MYLFRTLLAAIVLGLCMSEGLSAQELPQPAEGGRVDKAPTASQGREEAGTSQQNPINPPPVLKRTEQAKSEQPTGGKLNDEEDPNREIAKYTKQLAVYTSSLADFTQRLFYATGFLALAALGQFELTRRTAIRQLRAYVFIDKCEITGLLGDGLPQLQVSIKNSGETPAYKVDATIGLQYYPSATEDLVKSPIVTFPIEGASIPPGESLSILLTLDPFPHEARSAFLSGAMGISVSGTITYRNVFRRRKTTEFRFTSCEKISADCRFLGYSPEGNKAT